MSVKVRKMEIDKVASGKVNIISFYRKNKLIDFPPLPLKPHSEEYNYPYHHHLDGDDLATLNKEFPTIFPYDDRGSINSWADEMKREFKRLIMEGKLDEIVTDGDTTFLVKFVWVPA